MKNILDAFALMKYSKLIDYKKIISCFCNDIDAKKATLRKVIMSKISPKSIIYTDGWRGYNSSLDIGYSKYFRIDKSKSFANRYGVHINGIKSFWSFTKRRLAKLNGVKSTFELHLKECEWLWRKTTKDMEKEL